MKVNILYIFWVIALVAFILIFRNLQTQSAGQLFGIADTEGLMLKLDYRARVKKCYVIVGQQVKTGDTLMIFEDATIEKRKLTENTASNQIKVEQVAKNNSLNREIKLFEQTQQAQITELEGEIKILQNEIEVQNTLKKAISDKETSNNSLKHQEIKGLQDDIEQIKLQTKAQLNLFRTEKINNINISGSRTQEMLNALRFIDDESNKLVLLAPYDGFIEGVYASENEVMTDFKDLIKINPKEPNKITGFIHESINIAYNLGDTLQLISTTRPNVTTRAQLVGVSHKLVELPFRLRKYAEIKAWGREIYINLPPENGFLIGEKVMIKMH